MATDSANVGGSILDQLLGFGTDIIEFGQEAVRGAANIKQDFDRAFDDSPRVMTGQAVPAPTAIVAGLPEPAESSGVGFFSNKMLLTVGIIAVGAAIIFMVRK